MRETPALVYMLPLSCYCLSHTNSQNTVNLCKKQERVQWPLVDEVGCMWVNRQPQGTVPRRSHVVCSHAGSRYRQPPLPHLLAWSPVGPHDTHKWLPYLSSCHITNTRGCHLFCACLTLLCPHTDVMNLQEQNSCRHLDPDWLLRVNSDSIYCLGCYSLFRSSTWFHCHANRVWSRQAFDCHRRRVTHLMPWHWKIRGDRKPVMAHWEKRGNLLTVTFLLNVAWRRRINTEQWQGSWMENHFI